MSQAKAAVDGILELLRDDGRRLTPQRQRILEVLLDTDQHLDIDEIRERANHSGARVSSATVYRTMRMLVDAGHIKERHFKNESARYEYVEAGSHHDHLICTSCGEVVEFNNETIEELQEKLAQDHNYKMTAHKHEIYGLCPKCQAPGTGPKKRRN